MRYTISLTVASALWAGTAAAEVPRVVTDLPPVHALVSMVMGDLGQPGLLLDRGANAHSFQMRPSQAQALSEADLIVWIGPEMTPWLDRTLRGMETTAAQVHLLDARGTYLQDFRAGGSAGGHDHAKHDHDHAAEASAATEGHDHAEGEGHDHAEGEAHAHAGTDPHAWLDPANGALWLDTIAVALSGLDPANATVYTANAAAAQAQIAATDAEVAAILAPVKDKPFVVFHDAYGYFAGHYGLNVAGSVALGDASSPGAARLADLRAGMQAGSALCIFPEARHDPALVAQMAEGTRVRVGGTLDPEGAMLEPGPGLYPLMLRGLASTLADCLAAD
ncbi:zinc ABC transporter substrate-binding protein [Paracoccaceae bacterium Fryx2]|nr:zinc ABC transporter substrate-binding protein [Paracoccaceae bacterium Fryx2]